MIGIYVNNQIMTVTFFILPWVSVSKLPLLKLSQMTGEMLPIRFLKIHVVRWIFLQIKNCVRKSMALRLSYHDNALDLWHHLFPRNSVKMLPKATQRKRILRIWHVYIVVSQSFITSSNNHWHCKFCGRLIRLNNYSPKEPYI